MKKTLSILLIALLLVPILGVFPLGSYAGDAILINYGSKWEYVCYEEDPEVGLVHTAPEGWLDGTDTANWSVTKTPVSGQAWASSPYRFPYANYSAFLRRSFVIEDLSKITDLTMIVKYDENPTVYVNGTPVWSAEGYVDSRYVEVSLSDRISLLHEGLNTVQVAISNVNGGAVFDMALMNSGALSTYLERGSDAWEYLEFERTDNENPVSAPEGWATREDTSLAWQSGTAPFAAHAWNSDDAANTWMTYNAFDAYLRTTVTFEDVSRIKALYMDVFYDENPELYVNGALVWSKSGYSTGYVSVTFSEEMIAAFHDGENVIAVYFSNAKDTGYGSRFDMSLYGSDEVEYYDGKSILPASVSCEGFSSFGAINDPANVLDGDQSTVCGSGYNPDAFQCVTLTFRRPEYFDRIYLDCKNEGPTDGAEDMDEKYADGTRGVYSIYVLNNGEATLLADSVPAVIGTRGGYTLELDRPVKAEGVMVAIKSWHGTAWACVADIEVHHAIVTEANYDIDGDGSLTISDVTSLLNALAGIDETSDDYDLDGDGGVTISDVTALLNRISSV